MTISASAIIQKKKIILDDGRFLQVGALVYRLLDKELQVLLITSRKTRRWIIPKGWPIPGKTLSQAALREAYEEAGINGHACPEPSGYYTYKKSDMRKGKAGLFHVAVFAVACSSQEEEWPECKQRTFEWVSPQEAACRVHEPELKELLRSFAPPAPVSSLA